MRAVPHSSMEHSRFEGADQGRANSARLSSRKARRSEEDGEGSALRLPIRQEPVELRIELDQMLDARLLVEHAAGHDHLHVAQGFQVVERVAVEHDEVGRLARLDRTRFVAQP